MLIARETAPDYDPNFPFCLSFTTSNQVFGHYLEQKVVKNDEGPGMNALKGPSEEKKCKKDRKEMLLYIDQQEKKPMETKCTLSLMLSSNQQSVIKID